MAEKLTPFALLAEIASSSKQYALGLPAQREVKAHWSGVGFELLGHRFVAPLGEVAEILTEPKSTRLPGVKSWVKGVANVRGRLVPVMDLSGFFGKPIVARRKQQRILVVEFGDMLSGLLVDEVFGMQHLPVDSYAETLPEGVDIGVLSGFTQGSYKHEGKNWIIFSIFGLVQNTDFMQVAV